MNYIMSLYNINFWVYIGCKLLGESLVLFALFYPTWTFSLFILHQLLSVSTTAIDGLTAESLVRLIKTLKGALVLISHAEERNKASVFNGLGTRTGWRFPLSGRVSKVTTQF